MGKIFSVLSARILGARHQIVPKSRNVLCVVKPILTKTVQRKKKEVQNVQIGWELMSPTTEAVLLTRIKPSSNMWSKTISYASILKQASPPPPNNTFSFTFDITFDNRMIFTKHFEEILERRNHKFHPLRILVNRTWGPSPTTIIQIYKQFVRPIFEYGIVSSITVWESAINKVQRIQNSFIRPALRLQKCMLARLIHEASGLPYARQRHIT